MDETSDHATHQFLHSLRQYVLSPLSASMSVLTRERTELTAEIEAFEAFADRLVEIEPTATTALSNRSLVTAGGGTPADSMARVRTAYQETVMDVPHYDEMYAESLATNVAAEFGEELADGVRTNGSVSFTRPYKRSLLAATKRSIQSRREFVSTLDRERSSIEHVHTELGDIAAHLDTTIVAEWYRDQFVDRLDRIARERQHTIRALQSKSIHGGHTFHEYLYRDESWTYPALTAVTRLRETVVL